MFEFDSDFYVDSEKLRPFSEQEIKNEPMLFSCNLDAAMTLGGPITNNFLDLIPLPIRQRQDFIVDSRVHMLMEGWYPCIPGYHHDDVPRSIINGQPNYYNPEYKSKHVMCLVNGDICPTKFAVGKSNFEDIESGEKYYKIWHNEVLKKIENRELIEFSAPSNYPVYFDCNSWHTGTKAITSGWRFFIRASWNTHRMPLNEVRKQVQVYLEFPMEGW